MDITALAAARQSFELGEVFVRFEGERAIVKGPRRPVEHDVSGAPDALRERLRFDEQGRYRPLSGAGTMPGGWRVTVPAGELCNVIEAIYPLATTHLSQFARGELRLMSMDDVLRRQTGRYRAAASLDAEGRCVAATVLCGRCSRVPLWRGDDVCGSGPFIPCPEACSVLVSLCRDAAIWQQQPPAAAAGDLSIGFAAFEEPGNEVREAYLAARYGYATSDD